MTTKLELIAEVEVPEHQIIVNIYKTELDTYTTWWTIGAATFEIRDHSLEVVADLANGAIDFIEEEKHV